MSTMERPKLTNRDSRDSLFNNYIIGSLQILKVTELHPIIQGLFKLREFYENTISELRKKTTELNKKIKALQKELKERCL